MNDACATCGDARGLEALIDPPGTPCWRCQRKGCKEPKPGNQSRPRRKPSEIDLPDGRRVCGACAEAKPLGAFHKAKAGRRHLVCGPCRSAAQRARYHADPGPALEWARRYKTTKRGREVRRKAVADYKRRNAERTKARKALKAAVRAGIVVRPPECQIAGCDRPAVDAHHENYLRPLDVVHVCRRHHADLHLAGALRLKDGGIATAPPRPREARHGSPA